MPVLTHERLMPAKPAEKGEAPCHQPIGQRGDVNVLPGLVAFGFIINNSPASGPRFKSLLLILPVHDFPIRRVSAHGFAE